LNKDEKSENVLNDTHIVTQVPDLGIKKTISAEKLRILYQLLLISMPANFLCATVVFISLFLSTHTNLVVYWYVIVIITSLFRILSFFYYRHQPKKYLLQYSTYILGVVITAALWGFAASYLMPKEDLIEQMIIIVIIAGMTSGGVQTLQASRLASFLHVIVVIFPLCIWLFLQNGTAYFILGVAVTIYLFSMLIISRRGNKMLEQSLSLRYKNIGLIKNLSITNSKLLKSYHSIEEKESELQNIQENAPLGMAVISPDGEWIQVNNVLCEITGYKKTEFNKLHLKNIIHSDDWIVELDNINKMKQGVITSCQSEMRLIQKNGQYIWVLVSQSLMNDDKGKPLYFIIQIQDIDERKKNELIVIELNERTQSMLTNLQKRDHDLGVISKMNEMLQICQELNEAYSIINHTAVELFPSLSGGLIKLDAATQNLETIKQWGEQLIIKKYFMAKDCWALREEHPYIIDVPKKDLICSHFETLPRGGYLCLPQITQIGTIGMLVLIAPTGSSITPYQQQISIAFNDIIRLSLANIQFREILNEQSIHDSLTKLFNRRYLDATLPRDLSRVMREKKHLCVGMLDIDFFKRFNDTSGHEAGDEVLKTIGKLLNDGFRGSDIACRFGGEEFILVLINSDLKSALPRLEEIREKIKNVRLFFRETPLPQITISIGVAEAPVHGKTSEDIIRAADRALYQAKHAGRDRVEIFDSKIANIQD